MSKKIGLFAIFWTFISCSNSDNVYMNNVDNVWNKDKAQVLDFEITDAQNPKNIIFVVRNNNEYPYQNLFLISTLKGGKNEIIKTDTLQYILAKPNGEWLGNGIGNIKEILFQYKNNYKFPNNGKYQIEIKHGMRRDSLKGIEDIGVQIQNANTPQ